ncbi:hypothetical protein GX48_07320 [Paracoccidioides brasiliensis]|nr:hypothetical protein GX48_07320 [Paracoccidioides brasiliensis]
MHDIEQGIGNSGASTQANVVLVGHENTRRPTGLENLDSGATGITSAARRDSSWVVLGRPGSSWVVLDRPGDSMECGRPKSDKTSGQTPISRLQSTLARRIVMKKLRREIPVCCGGIKDTVYNVLDTYLYMD